jgi:hypothetical protein
MWLLLMDHKLFIFFPILSPSCPPAPTPPTTRDKEDAEHWLHALISTRWALLLLLYEITYWIPFTLKGCCQIVENHMLSDVYISSCKSKQKWEWGGDRVRWIDSSSLFSIHCINKCENFLVFVSDFSLPTLTMTPEGRWRSLGTSCWYRYLTPDSLPFLYKSQVSRGPYFHTEDGWLSWSLLRYKICLVTNLCSFN